VGKRLEMGKYKLTSEGRNGGTLYGQRHSGNNNGIDGVV